MRTAGILRALLIFLITIIGLLLLVFLFLNLPGSHRYATRKVNQILSSARLPVHISSVLRVNPGSLLVEGVLIYGQEKDTIVYAEKVRSSFKPIALLKNKVLLPSLKIENARVFFFRDDSIKGLNIEEAFTSNIKTEPEKSAVIQKPWEVSIGKIELNGLNFRMTDSISGIYVDQDVKRIVLETEKMSLAEKTLIVKSLEIEDETGSVTIGNYNITRGNEEKVNNEKPWEIGLNNLSVRNINLAFDDRVKRLKLDLLAGGIEIQTNILDLNKKVIDFDHITISGTSVLLQSEKNSETAENVNTENPFKFDWDITGENVNLRDLSFRMAGYPESADSSSVPVSVINMSSEASNLKVNNEVLNADIGDLKFDLGNGFSLKKFKGTLAADSKTTNLDFSLETGNSHLTIDCKADEGFFKMFSDPFKIKKADLVIKNSGISLNDLLYFKPELINNAVFKALSSRSFDLAANFGLKDSSLTISEFSVGNDETLDIKLKGKAGNIFQPEKITGDLQFEIPEINAGWLKDVAGILGMNEKLPDYNHLSINGIVSDSLKFTKFNISIKSDLGNIDLLGNLDLNNKSYSANSRFDNLMTGRLTGNQSLGALRGSVSLNGSGLDLKTLQANAILSVDSLFFNNYTYSGAFVEANLGNELIDISLKIDDPFIQTEINSSLSFKDSKLEATADGAFHADLQRLHLLKDSLTINGKLAVNFQKKKSNISTRLIVSDLLLSAPDYFSKLNQLDLFFEADSVKSDLKSNSDFFNLNLSLSKPVSEYGTVYAGFRNYFKSILNPDQEVSVSRNSFIPEINAKIQLKYDKFLGMAMSDTTLDFSGLNLTFVKGTSDNKIDLAIAGSEISYKASKIEFLNASLSDSGGVLNLSVEANRCMILSHPASKIKISSSLAGGKGLTRASLSGGQNELLYDIELGESVDNENIKIDIPSKMVVLNGVNWTMDTPGLLTFNIPRKTISPSLKMHTGNSFVKILTEDSGGSGSYKVELNNVSFNSIVSTNMIEGLPEGAISGSLEYNIKANQGIKIASAFQLADLKWHGLEYNIVSVNAYFDSNSSEDYIVGLTGRLDTAEVFLKGIKPLNGNRSLNAEFTSIPLSSFQPFAEKFLSDLKGYASGQFDLLSKDGINSITGDVIIKNGNLRINTLNSLYRIPDERIKFLDNKAIFNNFSVFDSLNHKLSVDGYIDYSNRNSILADLNVNSSNLQVMGRNEEKNASFYGNIFIDSRLSLKGPVTSPVLKGKIALTAGTDIFFRQLEDLALSESSKILKFESRNKPGEEKNKKPVPGKTGYNRTSIESIVSIDPSTRINIGLSNRIYKIDLAIQGGGELNYNMLSNGQVNLAGKYGVSEGSADLKMIGWPNKAFTISKGGYIYWSGNLDDPELKFEAVNKVKSSYVNPVDNKERYVDFDVNLKLSNRLSDMAVLFSISTPDQYLMSIINTLSPEEQMRQAITILLFKQIDLPGISTSSNYVTEQVNQMVATQLNQLTKTTIKGIDISFGIDSYVQATGSGGQETKTSLSYQVKRSLMNNRAQIELSGRINDVNKQPNSSDMSLNNFSFEYRLDSAATKFLKVYNEHSYEDVFEGEVIKTGVGFTYRKSYPTLGDIWRKNENSLKKPENK